MPETNFDLIVIGSGPAGQKGAICAAKLRKRVAVIDRTLMMGGVCVHTGTIPEQKRPRGHLSADRNRREDLLRQQLPRQRAIFRVQDLAFRVTTIVARETDVIRAQLKRNGVAIFQGTAQFADPHTIEVQGEAAKAVLHGENILIACGTRTARSPRNSV